MDPTTIRKLFLNCDNVYVGDTAYAYHKNSDFEPAGSKSYSLTGGADYASCGGEFDVSVGELNAGYTVC